ncbi:hypothetical protein CAC42_4564 [Sphaceloma murrayae]|uniref:Uncharacterized protein n=1 Tax=Sphaceloma murrayae TaxID=2082308 RepID=A0A2K1QNY7_9PEZI|nr:hypothetical protein CAC42_4564 [Sphaceloma murrayae]
MTTESTLSKYRYEFLFATWFITTGAAFFRVSRQPYSLSIRAEQYETIFKGTSLTAALIGIGLNERLGRRQSVERRRGWMGV